MNRRSFLKQLLAAGVVSVAGAVPNPFSPGGGLAFAGTYAPLKVVVVFLRGGCDGINVVVPYGDSSYASLRPTIAIPKPNGTTSAALDLNGFFGFHPALSPLYASWQSGQVAVFPAVQYPNPTRSHFDSEQIIEAGVDSIDDVYVQGWLNRYLQQNTRAVPLQAFGIEGKVPYALRGTYPALAIPDLSRVSGSLSQTEADQLIANLALVYGQEPELAHPYAPEVFDTGRSFLNDLNFLRGIKTSSYTPANSASYPSGGFGTQLKQLAQLVKTDCGLEVATVSMGGWDTHSGQGGVSGAQASRIGELAQGLAAFRTDLGTWGDELTVVVMSEFGREAGENASGGTDHGNAACWMAIGPRVKGGIYGGWPGLASSNLTSGRFLKATVDYRDILAEVVVRRLLPSADLSSLFPGHGVSSLGFLNG